MSAALEARILFGAVGAAAGTVCALALYAAVRYLLARLRPGAARSARVSALAARGAAPAEIARRTGLSRDAVAMLLQARKGPGSRSNLPEAARIAAAEQPSTPPAPTDFAAQLRARQALMRMAPPRPAPAHGLLDGLARSIGISRERKMA